MGLGKLADSGEVSRSGSGGGGWRGDGLHGGLSVQEWVGWSAKNSPVKGCLLKNKIKYVV